MQKEEWNEWDERYRRQSCEGSSERVRATSEFQKDLRDRTKAFALRIVRRFSALPKTTEAQVLGKQLLRSGTSIGANYREAFRRAEQSGVHREMRRFASRDRRMRVLGSRDMDGKTREVAGELLGKQRVKRLLAGTAAGIRGCQRGKARALATRVRRADRDFRYHPEAKQRHS